MKPEFSPGQLALLRIVQKDLPDSPTPFLDLARATGMEESEILDFLRELKAQGIIRRFGASIRHRESGWTHNAMVAWKATEEDAEKWAHVAVANRHVSHAYYRPSKSADWPYELYTMIHGRNPEDIEQVIMELMAEWPFREYLALNTLKELKKISMTYFKE